MEVARVMRLVKFLGVFLTLGIPSALSLAQQVGNVREQSQFSTEEAILPVERPTSVPQDALQALRNDPYVLRCLKKDEAPNKIPPSWFVASGIHLDGPDSLDLVVLPKNPCLFGANIGPFWVFRATKEQGYRLVLQVSAHSLKVLGRKSKGFRDIQVSAATARDVTTTVYKFDGQQYQHPTN